MAFFKKVSSNVARVKQVAMVKMGQSEATVDAEFNQLETQFKEAYAKIRKFGKYVQNYQSAVKDLGVAQKGMAQMIIDQYDSSDQMYHVATQLHENITAQIEATRIQMEQYYAETFHQPLTQYLGQYKIIDERIIERNSRLIDMDRYTAEYRALIAKPDSEPTKVQIAKEKSEYKTREYSGLNEELIVDIPKLLRDRSKFFDGLFANIVAGKYQYLAETARAMGLLQPNFAQVNRSAAANWPFVVTEPSQSSHGGKTGGSGHPQQAGAPPMTQTQQPTMGAPPSVNQQQPMMGAAPPAVNRPMAPPPSAGPKTATARYPFQGQDHTELSFQPGERITIINQNGDWWVGELNGKQGYFPSNYVQMN